MTTAARIAPAAALAAVLGACHTDTPPAPAVREVAPPSAPGSAHPHLEAAAEGVWMSWTEPSAGGHRVRVAFLDAEERWTEPRTVAESDGFFVNWADFPSVRVFGGRLFVHWLQRGGEATYDYGVRIAWSDDGGATWSPPLTPHEDGTPTEHGFVSFFADQGEVWAAWLDGRAMVEPWGPMSLRARRIAAAGGRTGGAGEGEWEAEPGPETVVDEMTCECCQTDAAVAEGVPVVVYRDRAAGEVRDILLSRMVEGRWLPGHPVHADGWVFGGCPVNGPAIAARDALVAVAWFTAPEGNPRVQVAFSRDGARTFAAPVRVDEGRPIGRVDLALLDDGSALVTWLEEGSPAPGPTARMGAAILGRRVPPDGSPGPVLALAPSSAARASGFPRIARLGGDRVVVAWTDPAGAGGVRARIVELQ